ncbi:methylmalonyl Co-A mutase-associated GTPase MeaB [Myxococcota bacterium]|nr:methylmalonyl Co-A mutase-associated GTPase MeaB [Myxococcota bacterium]
MTFAGVTQERFDTILEGVIAGDRRSLARALRWVDDAPALGRLLSYHLQGKSRGAHIIGITGNPGAGKSTLVDSLIYNLRAEGKTVAVLAIDPSSPFSGGAILGDRIRMSRHTTDDGVFIRSMATRGALGGLSRATWDSVRILDATGYDIILIETVGVGQDEIDVARLAQTSVVVMVPGLGDDIQAIKAGILEIADIFLINKSDRPGADEVERGLKAMMTYASKMQDWETPVLRSIAKQGEGIAELLEAADKHRVFLNGPAGAKKAGEQAVENFERLLNAALIEEGRKTLGDKVKKAREAISDTGSDPYKMVMELLDISPDSLS